MKRISEAPMHKRVGAMARLARPTGRSLVFALALVFASGAIAQATVIAFSCTLFAEDSDGVSYDPPVNASYDTLNIELDLGNRRAWDSLSDTWHAANLAYDGTEEMWCDNIEMRGHGHSFSECIHEIHVQLESIDGPNNSPLVYDEAMTRLPTWTTGGELEQRDYRCSSAQAVQE